MPADAKSPPDWHQIYQGYLFDLDGTLVDTAPDLNRALNFTLELINLPPVSEALTRHWVGHGARVMIKQALLYHNKQDPAALDDVDVEHLFTEFLQYYGAHIAHSSQPYPTVVDTLEHLHGAGKQLGVVTNKPAELSRRLLQTLELAHFFSVLVGGDTCAHPKPHPAPISLALDTLGLGPQQVLFVGDSETDVKAAHNSLLKVVCVPYGYNHGIDVNTLGANGVIEDFNRLLDAPH